MTSSICSSLGLVIFDLDGVVYRGDTPTPGAPEVMRRLRTLGYPLRFLTNNSSRSRASYCEKLSRMEIPTPPAEIMTSAYATACYLREQGYQGQRVLVVGEEGIHEELQEQGMLPVASGEAYDEQPVEAVVVGIDRSFNYLRLLQAQQAILSGAVFIATNGDPTFPTEAGDLPGGGSIVAAIQTASGHAPVLIGKPNTYSLELLLREAGVTAAEAVLIGDRLDTDIQVGRRAGLTTILTLTGVTRREDLESLPEDLRPHAVIPDLRELESLLKKRV